MPITAATAIKNYSKILTTLELSEILNYKKVYYLGQNANKIFPSINSHHNYNLDDENGDYKVV